jgi:hypothetical protein
MNSLEQDLAIIKDAIRANNGFIRQFLAAPKISSFFIAFGIAGVVLPLVWHFTLAFHGSFASLPALTSILLIVATAGVLVGLTVWKIKAISRAIHTVDPKASWASMVEELAKLPIFIAQGLLMLLTIAIAVIAGIQQTAHLIPAIAAGGIATVYLLYLVVFLLTEYMPITVWLYLFLVATLIAPHIPPLIMTAIGFGVGFILFGIFSALVGKRS